MSNTEIVRQAARIDVRDWIFVELEDYTDKQPKADITDRHHTEWNDEVFEWWQGLVLNYLSRARVQQGVPGGAQTLLKAATVMFEMAVTMALNSELPEPGHPSGEIVTW